MFYRRRDDLSWKPKAMVYRTPEEAAFEERMEQKQT